MKRMNVRYMIRKDLKANEKPIYVTASIGPIKSKMHTGRSVTLRNWNSGYPRKNKDTYQLREYLDRIQKEMEDWFYDLDIPGDVTQSQLRKQLKRAVEGDELTDSNKSVFDHYEEYLNDLERYKKTYNTIRRHRRVRNLIEEFNPELQFADINSEMCEQLILYLSETKGLTNTTLNKDVSMFSSFLRWCQKKNIISRPLHESMYFVNETEQTVVALTDHELRYIENTQLEEEGKQKVLDVFVLQANTGLSYNELFRISEKNLVRDNVLQFARGKSKALFNTPIGDKGMEVLRKYNFQLPNISNQYYNRTLKKIFQELKMERQIPIYSDTLGNRDVDYYPLYELIRSHVARATFISDQVNADVNKSQVEHSAGFSFNSKAMKRYIQNNPDDISRNARGRRDQNREGSS